MVISAFYGLNGAPTEWNGILVLPAGQDPYGSDILAAHAERVSADFVLTLMDLWVLDRAQLRHIRENLGKPVLHWAPIDVDPISLMDADSLRETGAIPVAMSRFGQRKLIEAGFANTLYAPHALDMSVFRPAEDRDALRRKYGLEDKWVIGIASANKDTIRKNFQGQMLAFARLHKDHPDTLLSIHAVRTAPTGLNLDQLAARLGISDAVSFNDQYGIIAGMFTQAHMAEWYGSVDLVSNAAFGGGFELALLEGQACGTPAVGTDCSAMTELCEVGWKVPGEPFWNSAHQSFWTNPSVAAIERVYRRAYDMHKRGTISKKREAARKFALAYNADDVFREYWVPIFEKLEAGTASGPVTLHPQDRERDAVLARLEAAFNTGILSPEEFGERAQKALTAAGEELAALVADLPEQAAAA